MKFVFIPVGSYGDTYPLIPLAKGMSERGFDVTVLSNGHFRSAFERESINFIEVTSEEEYEAMASNPDVWHPTKSLKILGQNLGPHVRQLYEYLAENYDPTETVLVSTGLGLGTRIAQIHKKFPLVTVQLQPTAFRSIEKPPRFPPPSLPRNAPKFLWRFFFWVGDTFIIDKTLKPYINGLLEELGEEPAKHFFGKWWNSPDLVLGLFPKWFYEPPSDWPPQLKQTGFMQYDYTDETNGMSPELSEFLDAGSPPIVFTPGSAMKFGHKVFQAALEACEQLGERGLFLTQSAESVPDDLPDFIIHQEWAPLSQILPKAKLLVCHGGVGTIAQGFQARLPILATPFAFDQYDNGETLQRLGVGDWLDAHKINGRGVTAKLKELLDRTYEIQNAYTSFLPEPYSPDIAITNSCDILEEFAQERIGSNAVTKTDDQPVSGVVRESVA
jgi:UDP:flavonoid glycosyltransferase YjiC (YdhE family)